MTRKELVTSINEQAQRIDYARRSGMGLQAQMERMNNILFSHYGEILTALKEHDKANEKLELLEVELADAEKELSEKDKELKALKGGKVKAPPEDKADVKDEQ